MWWLALALLCVGLVVGRQLNEWLSKNAAQHGSEPLLATSQDPKWITGPWGRLQVLRIEIERPDEFIASVIRPEDANRWFFASYSTEQLNDLFVRSALTEEQRKMLLSQQAWSVQTNGIWMSPSREVILGLSPVARSQIYSVLSRSPHNLPQEWPFKLRAEDVVDWTNHSGLSPATAGLMQRLLYTQNGVLCFADLDAALASAASDLERRQVIKVLSRQPTVLVKLQIAEGEDVAPLVDYWGKQGRAKDVQPLLESLTRIPGGASLDIAHLLTPFARMRLYTYPFPSEDPLVRRRDCAWTAMNFFNEEPDDHFYDFESTKQALARDYYPVQNDPAFGDVVVFYDTYNQPRHVAVYVAADIMFTKNGPNFNEPWVLMEGKDLVADYSTQEKPRTVAYRRKR